jgi:carbamoyl-phosphate synthase large subunit
MVIRLEPELSARGVRSFLPTLESFRARAKPVLDKLCRACGCSTPRSEVARDLPEARRAAETLGFPVMVKGQFYDAQRVGNATELARAFAEIVQVWGLPVLIQECISGGEFNVLGVGDGRGGVTALCCVRKTILSSKGKGISAVVLREPRLVDIASRIVGHLQWRGPFELELIYDEPAGQFRIIEMNPRFPAWVDFPSALGLNFPAQIVALLTDGRLDRAPEVPAGRFFIRHQVEMIGSMEELAQLMTEGIWQANRSHS